MTLTAVCQSEAVRPDRTARRPAGHSGNSGHRTETWILPDGRSCRDDGEDDSEDDFSHLSPAEVSPSREDRRL